MDFEREHFSVSKHLAAGEGADRTCVNDSKLWMHLLPSTETKSQPFVGSSSAVQVCAFEIEDVRIGRPSRTRALCRIDPGAPPQVSDLTAVGGAEPADRFPLELSGREGHIPSYASGSRIRCRVRERTELRCTRA